MNFEKELQIYTDKMWAERTRLLQQTEALSDIEAALADCNEQELRYVKYVLATLPISDLGEYDPQLFVGCVRHALRCREEFSWCKALSERDFLLWVLYPRINNEELSDCRGLFSTELTNRVKELSFTDAVLEVNRWCAEHVTYRSTDDRTASALAVYTCGFGRCGEESMFAVNALRSIGIAARQVYAPWWSHCDDNHAWVEVFDGENWHYLGACEPEPVLNRGWFTAASSRAMMIFARAFVAGERADYQFLFPQTDGRLTAEHGVAYLAVTERYAATVNVTVKVVDVNDKPVSGARVSANVLNMLAFREIWSAKTDETDCVELLLGRGSVLLSATFGEQYAEILANTDKENHFTLKLDSLQTLPSAMELQFEPPIAAPVLPARLTDEQLQQRRLWLSEAANCREKRVRQQQKLDAVEQRIAEKLSEKDRFVPIDEEVLADAKLAFHHEQSMEREQFEHEILPHRISTEPLRPWWALLAGREEFTFHDVEQMDELAASPRATLRVKCCNLSNLAVFSTARERANGRVQQGYPDSAQVILCGTPDTVKSTGFTVWRDERGFVPCEHPNKPGLYRALTVKRLPNGKQLASAQNFTLHPGECLRLSVDCLEGTLEEMLENRPLPPFVLTKMDGEQVESKSLWGRAPALLVWLEVGREPTEHILNELRETAPTGCDLHFILANECEIADPTLQNALSVLPQANLWLGNFAEDATALARQMFGDPDHLPLVLLIGCKGEGLYSCSGYNVGTAQLIQELANVYENM